MRVSRSSHLFDGEDVGEVARSLRRQTAAPEGLEDRAAEIVAGVRERGIGGGDAYLRALTAQLEATEVEADAVQLAVDADQIAGAAERVAPAVLDALRTAHDNIAAVAAADLARFVDVTSSLPQGQTVEIVSRAVAAAGVYVPGGGGSYPSSLLMGCVTARVAGVDRIAVVSPPGADGSLSDVVLAAAEIAGVDEVYTVGGAQAIAALAYGTESIRPVDVIVGPGSLWVNAAKRQVFGDVGIDGIAGPSELVVVLDEESETDWIAYDLLAQAEHGEGGLVVAAAPSEVALDNLQARLDELIASTRGLADNSTTVELVLVPSTESALGLADALAAEHLQLCFIGADAVARDRVAGCVFIGNSAATAFGDYVAGSNHVLPTAGAARFGGPLSVSTFMRRSSVVSIPPPAAAKLAGPTTVIAEAEGFPMHAASARVRGSG